jgi:hypothetical protein
MHEAPRRLVDDPAVSSSLRDDLARAGEHHHAYAAAYDAASKAAGLEAAIASQGGGAAGLGLLAKVALGVAAAAVFMFAGAALHARLQHRSDPARHDATVPAAPAPFALPVPPQAVQVPQAIAPQPPAAPVTAAREAPASLTRRAQHDDTQQEVRQLARIRAYLKSGDATSALELAERGQRELGQSALWQEREALAVLALFDLDRTEQAEQRSAVLLARFPNSPFRAGLEHRLRRAHER